MGGMLVQPSADGSRPGLVTEEIRKGKVFNIICSENLDKKTNESKNFQN